MNVDVVYWFYGCSFSCLIGRFVVVVGFFVVVLFLFGFVLN